MTLRNDWTREEIQALYEQPFLDLVLRLNKYTVSTSLPIQFRSAPFYLLKRVNVLKIANIALNLHITIQN